MQENNEVENSFEHNVLIRSLRPKTLEELIGNEGIVQAINNQFKSKRVPHFFLISGAAGTGKTTLARIIANKLSEDANITETNASDKNGIDDIRSLIENIKYRSLNAAIKVIIMDEAHQLTTQAQNTLLKPTEDVPDHVYFIFCTTDPNKIIDTLKRRAYIINTRGVTEEESLKLLERAKITVKSDLNVEDLQVVLNKYEIRSPGLILQAAEKFFNGLSAEECGLAKNNSKFDTLELCRLVVKSDWKGMTPLLKLINKEDIIPVRQCILGYLKTILLSGKEASVVVNQIKLIGEPTLELPVFLANIYLAANQPLAPSSKR